MVAASDEQGIVALDPSGRMRAGWPVRGMSYDYDAFVVTPDGSLLVVTDDGDGTEMHRIDLDGREMPGWPYRDAGAGYCSRPVATAEGSVILGCQIQGEATTIVVIDAAGRVRPGWPVILHDAGGLEDYWGVSVEVGPDGTVYALDVTEDGGAMARLWAFNADGSPRPGFPVALESGRANFVLAPGERILVSSYLPPEVPSELCGGASATILTELDAAGRLVPGWPATAPGFASSPTIASDGTVYYLAGDRAYARAPDGSPRPGWPVAIPPVAPECGDAGPEIAADGTVFIMADVLLALGPNGRPRLDWQRQPVHDLAHWVCIVDQAGGPLPLFAPDGLVYAALLGPDAKPDEPGPIHIAALDSSGRTVPGWPFIFPGWELADANLLGVVDGRLYLSLQRCGLSGSSTVLLALDPDGTISD
jgi:hypothetical protein